MTASPAARQIRLWDAFLFTGDIIQPEMARTSGSHVGSYKILASIGAPPSSGQGRGMGEVYRARCEAQRDVANAG